MERFYIDIRNGTGLTRDGEGQEFLDLAAAREQAVASIRSILSDELLQGKVDLRGQAEIRTGQGVVLKLPFREALQLFLDGC